MTSNPNTDMQEPQNTHRLGMSMGIIAFVLLLGLLALQFDKILGWQRNPNQRLETTHTGQYREIVLQRNRFGHYVATGHINGQAVDFIVDTGATVISIPAIIAEHLRLQRGPAHTIYTANGTATAYATLLDQVELGGISLNQVRASINPNMPANEVLLGMSFLKHLDFSQQGEQLILRQPL